MTRALHVLVVEDVESDAALLVRSLRRSGYEVHEQRVETAADMSSALAARRWDVVVSDYKLPQFDAPAALDVLKATGLDVPFIVVSGTIGEETAVAMMKAGAHDYLMKGNLTRLGPAVERELREARSREEWRKAEEALRQSERAYRDLVDNLNDVVFAIDMAGALTFVGPAVQRLFGYEPSGLVGIQYREFVHPEDRQSVEAAFQRTLAGDLAPIEFRVRAGSGSYLWVHTSSRPRLEDGRVAGLTGILTDITDRKLAEEALRSSEERFRGVFQATVDGMLVAERASGQVVMANGALCGMLGYSEAELLKRRLGDVHGDGVPEVMVALQEGAVAGAPGSRSVAIARRDGSSFVADISAVPVVIDGRDCILGVYRDTTALREMEAQMRQAQKMEAIGRLAGGVAHDFNNILGVILGHSELALTSLRDDDPLRENLEQIRTSADKAAALTRQLLVFSRKEALEPRVLDLNALVRNLGHMLERLIGDDVELSFSPGKHLGPILADPGQIEQVVINLAVNARDAMPDGGRIGIVTGEQEVAARPGGEALVAGPGPYVVLSVADTGCGMDDTVRQHIFEPFFTTKDAGKGTGLGLSTVYGIVQQTGGFVEVDSEVGRGTTFRVYLPRAAAHVAPQVSDAGPAVIRGRGETVLVVEDSAGLRDVVRDLLRQLDYRAIVAANGGEALLLVEETALRPDVLITDIVMPGMNGAVLADRLRKTLPDLKVLFMSGYADLGAQGGGQLAMPGPLLLKPFTARGLGAAIAHLIGRDDGETGSGETMGPGPGACRP